MHKFDLSAQRVDFLNTIREIDDLIQIGLKEKDQSSNVLECDRTIKGLVFVLLFAAYENLLNAICRRLIEYAASLKRPVNEYVACFRVVALHGDIQSVRDSGLNSLWNEKALNLAGKVDIVCEHMNSSFFPEDGTYMDVDQVRHFCDFFNIGDPASILKRSWPSLATIRRNRCKIAHGEETAKEVGGNFTINELYGIIDGWTDGWDDFVDHVEEIANVEGFWLSKTP